MRAKTSFNQKSSIRVPSHDVALVELLVVVTIIGVLSRCCYRAKPTRRTTMWPPTARTPGPARWPQPYKTIQEAANVAQAGDNVYVRGGTYRETVTVATPARPPPRSPSSPTKRASHGHRTGRGGQQLVALQRLDLSNHRASGGASQLFVGGQMMTEARFPNAGYNNPLHAATYTITGTSGYHLHDGLQTPRTMTGTPNWTNANLNVKMSNVSSWYNPISVLSRQITSQSGNTLSFTPGGEESTPAYFHRQITAYYITAASTHSTRNGSGTTTPALPRSTCGTGQRGSGHARGRGPQTPVRLRPRQPVVHSGEGP